MTTEPLNHPVFNEEARNIQSNPIFATWYRLVMENDYGKANREKTFWCLENAKGRWFKYRQKFKNPEQPPSVRNSWALNYFYKTAYAFEDAKDGALFRLTFGGDLLSG